MARSSSYLLSQSLLLTSSFSPSFLPSTMFRRLVSKRRKDSPSQASQASSAAANGGAEPGTHTASVASDLNAPLTLPKMVSARLCDWYTPMSQRLDRPIRVLSLDGGGFRGLSALMILKHTLTCTRGQMDDPLPRPCEVFDLIVGSSTGGLVALMLGRLGLSVDEAIDLYIQMGPRMFAKPRFLHSVVGNGRFDASGLRACMVEIAGAGETLLQPADNASGPSCYTLVTTSRANTLSVHPIFLRTYSTLEKSESPMHNWTVVEAACATSASPTYFPPVQVGDTLYAEAGAPGCNNPSFIAFKEAHRLAETKPFWRARAQLGPILMLSVGTGPVTSVVRESAQFDSLATNTYPSALSSSHKTKKPIYGPMGHKAVLETDSARVAADMFFLYNTVK
ncbi:hypothetical protein P7C70_g7315, partial [Phenoliferia sp. Uapishka_3]